MYPLLLQFANGTVFFALVGVARDPTETRETPCFWRGEGAVPPAPRPKGHNANCCSPAYPV